MSNVLNLVCINVNNNDTLEKVAKIGLPTAYRKGAGHRGVVLIQEGHKPFATFFPARY